jgi:phosphate ABC transporter phosphate-binding protein
MLGSRRNIRAWSLMAAVCTMAYFGAQAQSTATTPAIKTLYIENFKGVNGSDQLRDSLIKRFEKSSDFQITTDKSQTDAVLQGTGSLWVRGYHAINLRSPSSNRVPVYTGYLSVQLTSKSGEPLWSYLAVPSSLGWKTVTDDLTATVVKQLEAVHSSLGAAVHTSHPVGAPTTALTGAGATFPEPLYLLWFEMLREAHGLSISYSSVGSQEGMRLLADAKVDFAASEVDPGEDYALAGKASQYLRVASVLGGVVPVYNLDDLHDDVHFTPEVLADIYLGKIQRWNDPRIRKWNKGIALPDAAIIVVHRAEGSGTTAAWSAFLAKNSAAWKAIGGTGMLPAWPTGVGVDGNQGVASTVKTTKNSIGYVELVYALQSEVPFGAVQNQAGEFVRADLVSLGAAAASAQITTGEVSAALDSSDKRAYPIATLTWLLVPRQVDSAAKKAALLQMLQWALTSGQKACSALGYVPLPKELAERELQVLGQWK